MTRVRTTAILLGVAGLLTLWWVVYEWPRLLEVVFPGRIFAHLTRDDITSFEIQKRDGTAVVLNRGVDGRWRLVEPLQYPAALGSVDTMISALVFLEATQFLEEAEGAFSPDGARALVRFTAQGEVYTVEVGNRHLASEKLQYYRYGETLFLAEDSLKLYCDRSIFQWRDKTVCPLSPEYVGRVDVAGPGELLVLERAQRGVWFIRKPKTARADASAITNLIDGVNTLQVREFFNDDGGEDLGTYGLDDPRWRISVHALAGPESYEILIGNEIPDTEPAAIYVKRGGAKQIFRCEDTVTPFLGKKLDELRDLRVLPFADYGWVNKITLRGYGQDFSLVRAKKDGAWAGVENRAESTAFSTTKERAERLLDIVGNLKIVALRPEATIGAEQFRVVVSVEGRPEPMELIVGKEIEKYRYLARRSGVEGDEGVPFEIYSSLPGDVKELGRVVWEDPVRITPIPEDRFLHFEFITRQGRWLLLRFATWQVDGYQDVKIDQDLVAKAAEFARKPTASFFEARPGSLAAIGLTRERCRFRIKLHKGFGVFPYWEFLIGNQVDPGAPLSYAWLDTDPTTVFMLDPTPLVKLAEHLRKVCKPR